MTIRGDLAMEDNCRRAVEQTVTELGGLDVLVNNVATQEPIDDLAELSSGQWERTYVFFASGRMSSYYCGEVLAPIGGETLPG